MPVRVLGRCVVVATLMVGAAACARSAESTSALRPAREPAPVTLGGRGVDDTGAEPPALTAATSDDPVVAVRALDAYRKWLWAHPDPARAADVWVADSDAAKTALGDLRVFAAQGAHVDERGFVFERATLVEHDSPQAATVRIVLGPGDGRVQGIEDRTWTASEPVTFELGLMRGVDRQWRIATDTEIGAVHLEGQ